MRNPIRSGLTVLSAMVFVACGETSDTSVPDTPPETVSADAVEGDAATPTPSREIAMGALVGTMIEAGDAAPAVLIVPGSGPTDRDGNNPMGVRASPYRMLAEGLAEAGITSLRVDKRGQFGSAAAGDGNDVTVDLYAQDYLDWAALLRAETGRPCVHLLGHSEGGLMGSAAAAQDADGICGLILVAAPGRPVGTVLREQLQANPANAPILDDALSALDRLEAGERVDVDGLHPALQALFAPQVQGFLISLMAVDPVEQLDRADLPTLIVQGGRDLQVSQADAQALAVDPSRRLVEIAEMNHVLKTAPEGRVGNMATYANPDLPLADELVPAIRRFVEETASSSADE